MKPSRRLPSLRALNVFQVSGKHLSFKLAAEELFLTASAVSHQIKNLESFLGIDLFVRKTRGLELTEAGRSYHEFLSFMFARLETETHQLSKQFGRQLIRLCVPPFLANELLLPRLSEIKDLIPDADVRIVTQPSSLQTHPADADVSILLGRGNWAGLEAIELFPRKVMTACSPELKQRVKLDSPEDLDSRTLIVHEGRPESWAKWAEAQGVRAPSPSKVYRFDSMAAVIQAAAEGHGVALVYWPLSKRWFESGALVRAVGVEVDSKESFFVVVRSEDSKRKEVSRLVKWIVTNCSLDA